MNRCFATACLGGLLLLSAATVEAGHGHHHGHGGWHIDFIYGGGFYPQPWYTPYYYYPPPPPIVYAPQQVIVPLAQTTVPAATTSAAVSTPVPATTVRSSVDSSYRGSGVTIRNPAVSGGNVAFVVDSRTEVDLKPGDEMPLVQKGHYFVEFDRGGDFGTSKKTLTEGSYEFVVTPNGWDLQRTQTGGNEPTPTPVVRRNALPTTR